MVTDQQILRLRQALLNGMSLSLAAAKAGIDRKTARTYRQSNRLPSEVPMVEHTWRTRPDPFDDVWDELQQKLKLNPGLQARTLFADLQARHPGRFADGQLRTLQRRLKRWRAQHGPAREVFFAQVHHPGRLAASDFSHCSDLGVTIHGRPFDHLIYHFVLTYSNWETGTICFSESFESLSEGSQNALWELGGVPRLHREVDDGREQGRPGAAGEGLAGAAPDGVPGQLRGAGPQGAAGGAELSRWEVRGFVEIPR